MMTCGDCRLRKCLHTFNVNDVDECKRIQEVERTINRNKMEDWVMEIYDFMDMMKDKYNKNIGAEFRYEGIIGNPYVVEVNLNIY